MARIAGVDLPRDKRVDVKLQQTLLLQQALILTLVSEI